MGSEEDMAAAFILQQPAARLNPSKLQSCMPGPMPNLELSDEMLVASSIDVFMNSLVYRLRHMEGPVTERTCQGCHGSAIMMGLTLWIEL